MGRGYRWMYRLTGLPGWMRFGFSPGWWGMGPWGMSPCAAFLRTGRWPTPQAQAYGEAMQAGAPPYYGGPAVPEAPFAPQMAPEQELDFLKDQAKMLREELEDIESRIRDLEAEE